MDLDHLTGKAIQGWPHVIQSIKTLLNTRINSRVFLREFGSDVPSFIDAPLNEKTLLELYVSIAEGLEKWEPRFELTDIQVEGRETGQVTFAFTGNYRPNAHLGDIETMENETKSIRVQAGRIESWGL